VLKLTKCTTVILLHAACLQTLIIRWYVVCTRLRLSAFIFDEHEWTPKDQFPVPELTARVDGWPVSITRQHPCWRARVSTSRVEGQSTRLVETGLSTWAVDVNKKNEWTTQSINQWINGWRDHVIVSQWLLSCYVPSIKPHCPLRRLPLPPLSLSLSVCVTSKHYTHQWNVDNVGDGCRVSAQIMK